jgi:hypothetical protein
VNRLRPLLDLVRLALSDQTIQRLASGAELVEAEPLGDIQALDRHLLLTRTELDVDALFAETAHTPLLTRQLDRVEGVTILGRDLWVLDLPSLAVGAPDRFGATGAEASRVDNPVMRRQWFGHWAVPFSMTVIP